MLQLVEATGRVAKIPAAAVDCACASVGRKRKKKKNPKGEVPHVISISQSPQPRVALPPRDFLAGMNYVSQVASCRQHRRDICALASGGRLSFLHGLLDLLEGITSRLL